jgi:hypothetical protein
MKNLMKILLFVALFAAIFAKPLSPDQTKSKSEEKTKKWNKVLKPTTTTTPIGNFEMPSVGIDHNVLLSLTGRK